MKGTLEWNLRFFCFFKMGKTETGERKEKNNVQINSRVCEHQCNFAENKMLNALKWSLQLIHSLSRLTVLMHIFLSCVSFCSFISQVWYRRTVSSHIWQIVKRQTVICAILEAQKSKGKEKIRPFQNLDLTLGTGGWGSCLGHAPQYGVMKLNGILGLAPQWGTKGAALVSKSHWYEGCTGCQGPALFLGLHWMLRMSTLVDVYLEVLNSELRSCVKVEVAFLGSHPQ